MTKSITVFTLATLFTFALLGGCNKATDKPAVSEAATAPTAPTAPDKPAAPEAAVPGGQHDQPAPPATNSGSAASASVGANGVEARAGDVSVKLPD